jgi:hypothetical protein
VATVRTSPPSFGGRRDPKNTIRPFLASLGLTRPPPRPPGTISCCPAATDQLHARCQPTRATQTCRRQVRHRLANNRHLVVSLIRRTEQQQQQSANSLERRTYDSDDSDCTYCYYYYLPSAFWVLAGTTPISPCLGSHAGVFYTASRTTPLAG